MPIGVTFVRRGIALSGSGAETDMTKVQRQKPIRVRGHGTRCIWPRGMAERFGVSDVTIWRWEKAGRLPPRDVFLGGVAIGWRPETLEAAERGDRGA